MHDHTDCSCAEDVHYSEAQKILAKAFEEIGHYGLIVDATLYKAIAESDFKEFFLKYLFDNNKEYFLKWYVTLKKSIQNHLQRENVFPLTDADLNKLEKLFSVYKDAFEWNAMGWKFSPNRVAEITNAGLIDKTVLKSPELSFRMGLLGDVMKDITERHGMELSDTLKQGLFQRFTHEAAHIGMTKIDYEAVEYAKKRMHGYIRPLLSEIQGDLVKDLHAEETTINAYVLRGIRDREGMKVMGRKLGNEMRERGYSRDYDRVMRTELGESYSLGRWQYEVKDAQEFGTHYTKELTQRLAVKATDLLVYKRVNQNACKYCREIWTHEDGTPKLYTENYVKTREPNYGKRAADWMPQLGLIHPNCSGEGGVRVARFGVDNLVRPKLFDYPVQDNLPYKFSDD